MILTIMKKEKVEWGKVRSQSAKSPLNDSDLEFSPPRKRQKKSQSAKSPLNDSDYGGSQKRSRQYMVSQSAKSPLNDSDENH